MTEDEACNEEARKWVRHGHRDMVGVVGIRLF